MTVETYTRLKLAESQLESAVGLFITGQDRFSVITLAGAADVILARLVLNEGKQTFTDHLIEKQQGTEGNKETRETYGKQINDTLFINQLKHFDDHEDGYIEIEPEECALGAILKAFANYQQIKDHQPALFAAFRQWMSGNLDPKKYNIHSDPNWQASS